jgi:hypothetical protein
MINLVFPPDVVQHAMVIAQSLPPAQPHTSRPRRRISTDIYEKWRLAASIGKYLLPRAIATVATL